MEGKRFRQMKYPPSTKQHQVMLLRVAITKLSSSRSEVEEPKGKKSGKETRVLTLNLLFNLSRVFFKKAKELGFFLTSLYFTHHR